MNYKDALIPADLKAEFEFPNYICDNAYMLFHRFLDGKEIIKDKKNRDTKNNNYLKNYNATSDINAAMMRANKRYINIEKSGGLDEIYSCIHGQKYHSYDLKLENSMVIGLGQQSVMETSMTLHPIYGVPYIPGQAFKGIVRSFYIQEFYDRDEKKAMENPIFASIFGRENISEAFDGSKGNVIFYDAFIKGDYTFESDIMSCHNVEYYQKGNNVRDSENPNIIKFNVIKNAVFHFGYAYKNGCDMENINIDDLKGNMIQALIYYGIGAKTSVGYGHFAEMLAP